MTAPFHRNTGRRPPEPTADSRKWLFFLPPGYQRHPS